MLVFPNAKINIGLHILNKLADNYHGLQTVMIPVLTCFDSIEITENKSYVFEQFGQIEGIDIQQNIVTKAVTIFRKQFAIPHVKIYLIKQIPNGAGLGGGSADAAFTLKGLNTLFGTNANENQLIAMATELGSDVPFFINNTPAIASGRGEILTSLDFDIKSQKIVLIKPEASMPTALAYSTITPNNSRIGLNTLLKKPQQEWINTISNDFELTVFDRLPILKVIKEKMYEAGAVYAAMSGSGTCIYGLFSNQTTTEQLKSWATNQCYYFHEGH